MEVSGRSFAGNADAFIIKMNSGGGNARRQLPSATGLIFRGVINLRCGGTPKKPADRFAQTYNLKLSVCPAGSRWNHSHDGFSGASSPDLARPKLYSSHSTQPRGPFPNGSLLYLLPAPRRALITFRRRLQEPAWRKTTGGQKPARPRTKLRR